MLAIEPLSDAHLDDAGILLARRHAAQRLVEPALAARFEDPAEVRAEIEQLLAVDGASGVAAVRDGRLVGYLLGVPRAESWGPNVWIESAGHAVEEAETVRDLYAVAAAEWVAAGLTSHYVLVPASDADLVDTWFRLSFGQQHVHGLREAPEEPLLAAGPGLTVRRAQRGDIPALAELDLALVAHQALSPVFSGMPQATLEETVAEYEEGFDDPAYALFVAERDGRVIGSSVGCSIEQSSAHAGLARPDDAGFLAFAAVFPDARGRGAGRALGEAVIDWSREAGYANVVTDWRATNLLSSRTWPRLGFRPTFLRLFRAIP
ncbi:MAG TPA: GNAT family N-acetyltransferase [Gaiella sp.]|jgi:GNAT superfamily N-acetyltransferase